MLFHRYSYYGSEKEILGAFSKLLDEKNAYNIRAIDITREAGLAKSSFYAHYKSIGDLVDTNENRVLKGINSVLASPGFEKLTPQGKWRNILLYLYQYREVLDIMIKIGNIKLLEKIFNNIEKYSNCQSKTTFITKNSAHVTKFCLISELYIWQKESFSIDDIPVIARDLAFISTCAPRFFARLT